jgi:D-alanine-D-alanine ligase
MTLPAGATVLVLHNTVGHESPADARDILDQVECVCAALRSLGWNAPSLAVDLRLDALKTTILAAPPDVVFNLVEAIDDCGQLVPIVTALLDHLQVPYTGCSTEGLLVTGNKILTKQWLRAHGMPTADWWDGASEPPAHPGPGRWITKPVSEDASIGMDDDSVVADFIEVPARVAERERAKRYRWFAERFVEGREINVALLEEASGPRVLPIPEIEFVDYPPGKPRIVSYAAKWIDDSFESRNTVRRFLDPEAEPTLSTELARLSVACWNAFQLRGYARVDYRVDEAGKPWILEVNANPCITPDAGFAAAVQASGRTYAEGIAQIVAAARHA